MDARPAQATILIVDDEEANLLLLERILGSGGYTRVIAASDPRDAIRHFEESDVDLVITDLHMPHLSGLELIDALIERTAAGSYLPIAMITADVSPEAEQEALSRGAKDFITKPFKASQIHIRVHNLLHTRQLHLELQRYTENLEALVQERTIELEAARLDILERLAQAAEFRDHTTGRHTHRVGVLAGLLAAKVGFSDSEVELIKQAAPLHDVGKIGIPDHILLKPGKLTSDEFATMTQHVGVGVKLLSRGQSDLIHLAELIALTHHERWDGSGYPRGLKGDAIPLAGQVVAVADVFDTLVNERPYKPAWPYDNAVAEMQRQGGHWFSPRLVEALLEVLGENPDLLEELKSVGVAAL